MLLPAIASTATVAQMTNLLWTKATRVRTLAANGAPFLARQHAGLLP